MAKKKATAIVKEALQKRPLAKLKKVEPKKEIIKINYSKYDNYQVVGDGVYMFLNPHTGEHIQVPEGTTHCPITGKKF